MVALRQHAKPILNDISYVDMCSKVGFVIYKHRIAGVQSTQQLRYQRTKIYDEYDLRSIKGKSSCFRELKNCSVPKKKEQILAPVAGQAVPLSEVPDPAFAQEILGKGVAIQPAEK